MTSPLAGKSNPKLKQARALRQRKEREATGLFLVEGIAHVGAALESGARLEYVLYAPETLTSEYGQGLVEQARRRSIECVPAAAEALASVSEKDHPSGLLAVARKPSLSLQSLIPAPQSIFVALVAPQDPGNIGAILRTLDAVSGSGLLLLEGGADPYHPNAVRASMGALFYVPVVAATFEAFVAWGRAGGCFIVGTSARAEADYRTARYPRPLALLMGSEQKGLAPAQLAACDLRVRIPMQGRVNSLNLAVAAGVLMYAAKGV